MNTTGDLILIGALAAVWLAAGLLAEGLPVAGTARAVGRRAKLVSVIAGVGVAAFVTIAVLAAALPGTPPAAALPPAGLFPAALLPAVPALVVLVVSLRRLSALCRAAATFATAPLAPLPPALRAAAAHPLIAAPLQVTGLAALVGVPIAGGLVELPGADLAGIAIALVAAAAFVLGLRHARRHSRLSLLALAPIRRRPRQLTSVR